MKLLRCLTVLLVVLALAGCSRPAPAPTAPQVSKEELNDKAFTAIEAKDFAQAIKLAEQAVAADPNFAPARFNLGLALYRTERYADAVPHLKAAYELNKESADPGWFLALALEQAGEPGAAMMVMQDLAFRFPADADVAKELQRMERGPVVWAAAPEAVFLGERLVVLAPGGLGVEARDAAGKVVWQHTLPAAADRLVVDSAGQRVLAAMAEEAAVIDVASGALVLVRLKRPEDVSGKGGGFVWVGDRLYVGQDHWGLNAAGGGRYMSTSWRMYRTQGSAWEQVFLEGRNGQGQSILVSPDGLTALVSRPAGPGGELFVDGKPVGGSFESAAAVGRQGQVFAVAADGTITRLNAEGKPVWDRAGIAGYPGLRVWPRGAEDWLVAVGPAYRGWAVLKGREPAAFKGEGDIVALTDTYLIERSGDSLWVLDGSGQLVARYKGAYQVTPDGRWVFQRDGRQIKAYRLP